MKDGCLTLPVSTTYLVLGIVSDVSATFVAMIHILLPSGGGLKTLACLLLARREYSGNTYSGMAASNSRLAALPP